jgi:hypothetical protein
MDGIILSSAAVKEEVDGEIFSVEADDNDELLLSSSNGCLVFL